MGGRSGLRKTDQHTFLSQCLQTGGKIHHIALALCKKTLLLLIRQPRRKPPDPKSLDIP